MVEVRRPHSSIGCALLLYVPDHRIEIREAGAEEGPSDGIASPGGNDRFVHRHVELTGPARHDFSLEVEALTNEGDETRRLGL